MQRPGPSIRAIKPIILSFGLLCLATIFPGQLAAAPPTFALQGQIVQPDGQVLEASSVTFTVQILSETNECLLHEETFSANMSNSLGLFSLSIGTGTNTAAGGLPNLTQAMDNSLSNQTGLICAAGSTYDPSPQDRRKLRLSFNDGSGPVTLSQDHVIASAPYAQYAAKLEGKSALEFIQVNSGVTQTNLEGVFDGGAVYSALTALLNGTSTLYETPGSTSSAANAVINADSDGAGGGDIDLQINGTSVAQFRNNGDFVTSGNGFVVDASSSRIGLGVAAPSYDLSLAGDGPRIVGLERHPTLDTAGSNFELLAGGATSGATDKPGGDLYLKSGAATGSNGSSVFIQTATPGIAGTADRLPSTKMTILGNGNIGMGVSSPSAKLSVDGVIQVGESADGCTIANKGGIRYNDATSVLEFCNGAGWNIVQAAACTDATPDVFSFADQANAALTTLVTSDIVQVNGLNCAVPVTIAGPGSPQFQICSDSGCATVVQGWTSAPSSLVSGQYLQVRQTTDGVGGSTFQATVLAGSGASVWGVTTAGSCLSSPAPGTACADGTIYAGVSPDAGGQPMYTTRCDVGMTWDGVVCNGIRSQLTWNSGLPDTISTGYISAITGKDNSQNLAGLVNASSPYIAAQFCEGLSENGNTDWYLPSEVELGVLYSNRTVIRNFSSSTSSGIGGYWSSTEVNPTAAHRRTFGNGATASTDKEAGRNVRCVRR